MRDSLSNLKAEKCHKPGHVAGSCGHLQELRVTLTNSHPESGTSVARSWILPSSSQLGRVPKPHDSPSQHLDFSRRAWAEKPAILDFYLQKLWDEKWILKLVNLWWFVTEQYKMNICHLYTDDSKTYVSSPDLYPQLQCDILPPTWYLCLDI